MTTITRDARETRLSQMQAAMLLRYNRSFFLARKPDVSGSLTNEYLEGCGPDVQRQMEELGRPYRASSLIEMARDYLAFRGIDPHGMNESENARLAMQGQADYFAAAESTSPRPSTLANRATNTSRQAYEAYPRTFEPFCRKVSATDCK